MVLNVAKSGLAHNKTKPGTIFRPLTVIPRTAGGVRVQRSWHELRCSIFQSMPKGNSPGRLVWIGANGPGARRFREEPVAQLLAGLIYGSASPGKPLARGKPGEKQASVRKGWWARMWRCVRSSVTSEGYKLACSGKSQHLGIKALFVGAGKHKG